MKPIRYWLKSTQPIKLSTLTMMWICTNFPVLADTENPTVEENPSPGDTPTVVPPPLNPSDARANVQIAYAINVGQQLINALKTYQTISHKIAPEETFNWFVNELLGSEERFLIQAIEYVPEESILITMQRNSFVEPLLHGVKFAYIYRTDAKAWELDPETSTIAAAEEEPSSSQIGYWTGIISNYCEALSGKETVSDKDWCQEWLETADSPPSEEEVLEQ